VQRELLLQQAPAGADVFVVAADVTHEAAMQRAFREHVAR
jgi:hypothetical protein